MEKDLSYSGEGRNYEPVGHNRPDPPVCGLSREKHWSSTRGGASGSNTYWRKTDLTG